jgi:hypothetical protein
MGGDLTSCHVMLLPADEQVNRAQVPTLFTHGLL